VSGQWWRDDFPRHPFLAGAIRAGSSAQVEFDDRRALL